MEKYEGQERRQGHFEGFTEAQINTLFNYFAKLDSSVERIERDLQALNAWKAQTIGGAIAASAIVSFIVSMIQ